jgi:hypothetical protein
MGGGDLRSEAGSIANVGAEGRCIDRQVGGGFLHPMEEGAELG